MDTLRPGVQLTSLSTVLKPMHAYYLLPSKVPCFVLIKINTYENIYYYLSSKVIDIIRTSPFPETVTRALPAKGRGFIQRSLATLT